MMESLSLSCFKAYDIRGQVPGQLNKEIAYRIGRAYGQFISPCQVVVGYDVRRDSPDLASAVSRGLLESGSDVIDIGLCGTEEVYFQTFHRGVDGGIMVTASHNPIDYNGMKLVREGSRPISGDSGLYDIRDLAERGEFSKADRRGQIIDDTRKDQYVHHLLSYVNAQALKPLRIVVNAGNGSAGLIIDRLAEYLPFEFIRVHHEPDGSFPHGIPNPLLPENRAATVAAIRSSGADFGIAWDGDFDRCFFFDEHGQFIEGYYLIGLLATQILARHPRAKIIHDPRLIWNTIETVTAAGGIPILSKTGHAFIKERMRAEDAVYGGEMSAHHYFRDFAYCDSGMIPWLLVAARISASEIALSELVGERMNAYPCSGEINYRIDNAQDVLERVASFYAGLHPSIDHTDGLSYAFDTWRFNLRLSNTEPLMRLNVETKGDSGLLAQRVAELAGLITQ